MRIIFIFLSFPDIFNMISVESPVYENEDQLLWQPDILPESKVKEFLHEVTFSCADGAMRDRKGLVKDNEQVRFTASFALEVEYPLRFWYLLIAWMNLAKLLG